MADKPTLMELGNKLHGLTGTKEEIAKSFMELFELCVSEASARVNTISDEMPAEIASVSGEEREFLIKDFTSMLDHHMAVIDEARRILYRHISE